MLYLISWIFIGNLSLLNLFLAILLDGFTSKEANEDFDEAENEISAAEAEEAAINNKDN
jgi:hypothetical protein